ncbi:chemotaxis protein CheB [soil metagenome]
MPNDSASRLAIDFPVVGIGASAGGLEALEIFFGACAPVEGCAFVVVQHLSTAQPSLLPELLQRSTTLPVRVAEHGERPRPGQVHVMPPGFELRLADGVFQLARLTEGHKSRLPIDVFFSSLAESLGSLAVGVVLSGMGADGTEGLRRLKDCAGATFVQALSSAQFDSMPRSAIEAGVADVVAEPAGLPASIAAHLAKAKRGDDRANADDPRSNDLLSDDPLAELPEASPGAIAAITQLLAARTGHDFSLYKKSTLQRRIERRMSLHRRRTLETYEQLLRDNPAEADLLFKELLIGVTWFFRDPPVWEQLERELIPGILARHAKGGVVRIWVAACSTGEEVYSLAMVFLEAMAALTPSRQLTLKIFATDIDKDAIARARAARYPAGIAADVTAARLDRFFERDERGYQVSKEVRETVIFALQNVAMDPPFTKLDMLVCRNLMIYFEPDLQRKLLPLFHYSLEPEGLLMLGTAETVGPSSDYFEPVAGKSKVFRRIESFRRPGFVAFPAAFDRQRRTHNMAKDNHPDNYGAGKPNLQSLADHLLLQRYAPAAVLVTHEGDVLYISGKTGRYLEPAAGKANWNVLAMAREGLRGVLATALRDALQTRRSITAQGVIVDLDFGTLPVRVTIDPISSPGALSGMVMIVFADGQAWHSDAATRTTALPGSATPIQEELAQTREALRAAREDAQGAEEQSRAANEELQSTNEELQSTNEELTTSKEEMQSMNEELQTVNQELQAKVDELSQASDDMRNLLNSTDIATLFLDEALRIRRFTPQATNIFKLIAGDVGRPITDITNDLADWALAEEARVVLDSLVFSERDVAAAGGRWFKVRTMPYRTFQNRIDGVVITFSDITRAKRLEHELQATQRELESRLAGSAPPPTKA